MENPYGYSAWLYDMEQNRKRQTVDIPFYRDYAHQQKGEILELGCGTGRIALILAKEGFNVTGIDLSKQMLDSFHEKLSLNKELLSKVTLVHGNMADFSLHKKFALIIVPFRGIQMVTDDDDVKSTLKCVREHLTDDGIFIVNVFKPSPVMDESWCQEGERFNFEVFDDKTGIRFIRKSRRERIDPPNQIIYSYHAYEVTYPDGNAERIVDRFKFKYYYEYQLRNIVEQAGLEIIEEYTGYDKTSSNGKDIIFVCKKQL